MYESNSGRGLALFVGGIALGIVGSRLLAPVAAMGAGALRAGRTGDPFAKLENDHRLILETLREMESTHDTGMGKRSALFLAAKRKLAKHAMAEEDVVYPLLSDEGARREAAMHLYEEHAEMKMLLYHIEMALMRGEPWTEHVTRLREMVERHAREEEQEQFPRLREVLHDRVGEVGSQVHREEALIL